METGIGATLRDARNRRKVELAEAESAIKIRARYLRAMENEEWDLLPGGAYNSAFIKTYATYLGLDGSRLAEDYRRSTSPGGGGERAPRIEPVTSAERPRRRFSGRLWIAAAVSLALLALLIGTSLSGDEDDSDRPGVAPSRQAESRSAAAPPAQEVAGGVSVELAARAAVWVCLQNGRGEPLVDGQILEAGVEEGPFRAGSFEVSFGNGEVTLLVDGEEADVPVTSSPIGFAIGSDGELTELSEAERPSCA